VVGIYNEKGQLVDERVVTPQPFALYEPEFANVTELVADFMRQVKAQVKEEEAGGDPSGE
jgi:hypothetical protein